MAHANVDHGGCRAAFHEAGQDLNASERLAIARPENEMLEEPLNTAEAWEAPVTLSPRADLSLTI